MTLFCLFDLIANCSSKLTSVSVIAGQADLDMVVRCSPLKGIRNGRGMKGGVVCFFRCKKKESSFFLLLTSLFKILRDFGKILYSKLQFYLFNKTH